MPIPQLFISHAVSDKQFLDKELLGICRGLKVRPWYSEDEIPSADYFEGVIKDALVSSDLFLLVMSPRSAASRWVKDELDWALDNMPRRSVIPILSDKDCTSDDFGLRLRRLQYIDFVADPVKAREDLIEKLVEEVYEPFEIYTTGVLTGKWNSFWETKVKNEPEWVSEVVDMKLRCGVYLMEANNVQGRFEWIGRGRFQTNTVFVFSWKIRYPQSQWSGVGTVYRNPEGKYLVGHWYGPNSRDEPIIGRWIMTRADDPDGHPVQVAKDWFGASTANSLQRFLSGAAAPTTQTTPAAPTTP
jgi:TIR domain